MLKLLTKTNLCFKHQWVVFLSPSANVYCLVTGDLHTKDKGPPLTSNGQSRDTQVTPRGRGFCLGLYLHGLVHIDGSLHIPVCPPCLPSRSLAIWKKLIRGGEYGQVLSNKLRSMGGVWALPFKCNIGGFIPYYLIKQNSPQLTVMRCASL